ncbi:FliH/SctL family protein [Brevibacillus dissolubilis]|uniref:FliH/SctL family protein n=1 Tax=Brevibacillus dissolubilis TaxID=1844116 RepID=UPI001117560A|nr:FliH/SctL family protein [Brevibacillus dissolubilis]
MISLSRVFKASSYSQSEEKVVLQVKASPIQTGAGFNKLQENVHPAVESAEAEAQTILQDAEEMAQRIMEEAGRQAEELRQQAMREIEAWQEQARQEAEQAAQEIFAEAQEQGMAHGIELGRQAAIEEQMQHVTEAREVLQRAYVEKERIIAQGEPFLVELSTQIAKKIIGDEISQAPDKVLEMARNVLRRSRLHGQITLCVNHRYFSFIEEHREQLLALLDGQAELSIYPDYGVADEGCVIRTLLGSVDARIDTQLSEIKQVLLDLARGSEANGLS